ncbi:DNA mismatch repair protein MutS domain-containing protein [Halovivax asiaticus JCM 14624]|uniref:DNA-binding protein MutS2 n=1 Tax=Halovivax asiaticus JCM 14624 TaxID=1227490 RepID=M0BGG7_9EURY|nr:helix-hairpin-helix domain-containing protein [Halovivax asiaticus]ELZ09945.1 DNA mismatch repair protein MutS domain-containing protein [Halovivax asiaticus JCM 14624]
MELEAIPGVGTKTAASLAELEDPERALREGDVAALASAPGVTPGRAARIARAAIRDTHGDPGGFLGTDRAREIYRDLLALLQARAVTDYAARRLETFYPSARRSRIEEAREIATDALEREPTEAVLAALSDVEPVTEPGDVRVRERCLATTNAERYSAAREAFPELSVEIVEDARGLAELARGYATVIALDEQFAGVDVEGDVRVRPDAFDEPVEIVPERPLAFFSHNRDRLRAAVAVHRESDLDAPCDLDALASGLDRLDADGAVAGDDELDRLEDALDELDDAVAAAEDLASAQLKDAIAEQDVTIEGSDLLSLVERGAGADSLLSRELADEYDDAVTAAREHLVETLNLDDAEAEVAARAFPDEPTFPVSHETDVVARLREDLQSAMDRRAGERKRELANDLADMREDAETLVRRALELDVELAIARFAADYDCTVADFLWDDEERGTDRVSSEYTPDVAITGGRSPLLDEPPERIDPVDYEIAGVRLLSGVNSGGKTSTLDLVAAVVVLAHMGLPVPADAVRLRRFDGVHYHAKTQGTLDAGAFESTVRGFADLATGADGGLVLVDELESITEPGASAKIIAGILEALAERDATGVFVSHLADEIRETAGYDVPVDGIEATGLVDGELQVERSPVPDHLARSTPELIVEKLADEAAGGEREPDASAANDRTSGASADGGVGATDFYERLLAKFE